MIKILGAGPSGLSAAINLAKAGYEVEIYERKKDCGDRFLGDLQGLENWTNTEDITQTLKGMNIDINFDCHPFDKLLLADGKKTSKEFEFKAPLFYLVKRGNMPGTLDQGLKQQALDLGVKIHFKATIPETEADIIATGPNTREIFATDKGIVFKTNMPDMAVGLVNDKVAIKGYSYMLITKGYGCICTVLFEDFNRTDACFKETMKAFEGMFTLDIQEPKKVGGIGAFSLQNNFMQGNAMRVGESSGLQDLLWGFGIRSAITSGYLAAQAIIHKKDYAAMAENQFKEKLKATVVLRYIYEKLSRYGYGFLVKYAHNKVDTIHFLHRAHLFGKKHKFIYPFALRSMKKRFPDLKL
ncbi:MAG: NAD(P)/FAD-dependent oxidoreductase [Bacteroidetes bacterium]|nr:NAD(P)/FAD-dependent oxidoreductase [Bacteroidota bacterium]